MLPIHKWKCCTFYVQIIPYIKLKNWGEVHPKLHNSLSPCQLLLWIFVPKNGQFFTETFPYTQDSLFGRKKFPCILNDWRSQMVFQDMRIWLHITFIFLREFLLGCVCGCRNEKTWEHIEGLESEPTFPDDLSREFWQFLPVRIRQENHDIHKPRTDWRFFNKLFLRSKLAHFASPFKATILYNIKMRRILSYTRLFLSVPRLKYNVCVSTFLICLENWMYEFSVIRWARNEIIHFYSSKSKKQACKIC